MAVDTAVAEVVSKTEFARLLGQHKSTVAKWIARSKLKRALVGSGPTAQIHVPTALAELGRSLRADDQLTLPEAQPAPAPVRLAPVLRLDGPLGWKERHDRAKAETAELELKRAQRREAEEQGIYLRADAARADWAREASRLVEAIELWLAEAAKAQAEAVGGEARALEAVLRREFRRFRERRRDLMRAERDGLPPLVADPAESEALA